MALPNVSDATSALIPVNNRAPPQEAIREMIALRAQGRPQLTKRLSDTHKKNLLLRQ